MSRRGSSRYQRERRKRTRLANEMVRRQQALNQRSPEQKAADEEKQAEADRAHFEQTAGRRKKETRGYFWNGDVLCVREYGRVYQVAVYAFGRLMTFAQHDELMRSQTSGLLTG